MEEHHLRLILNYERLTEPECGFKVEHILDYLVKDNVFRADECGEVLAEKTTTAKAKCLLDFLLEKGVEAYTLFREGLKVDYPHFADDLDNTVLTDVDRCRTLNSRRPLSVDALRSRLTLPALSTTLIGRNNEHCTFLKWLQGTSQRLYMFTGPPGIGKTVLMVSVCREYQRLLLDIQEEQLFYFDMNSYDNIDDLATDMLISLQQSPVNHPVRHLCNLLRSTNGAHMLIFDNVEDTLSDSLFRKFPEFLNKILQCSTGVRAVMSSRFSFKFLIVDYFEEKLKPLDENDGISLAQKLLAKLNPENASRLCKINGYLPLAICLTSVLLRHTDDCDELLTTLEEFPTMTVKLLESIEGEPASSQIIQCFHSCFNSLNQQQQQAMRAFAIFPSTFTRKAAEAVCGRGSSDSTQTFLHAHKMLRTLVDRSMLMFDEEKQKYQIHPLLRSFCCTLVTIGDKMSVEDDFCQHYIRFAQNCCQRFYWKECYKQAVQEFWSERQNIIHCFMLCNSRVSLTRLTQPFASRYGLEFLHKTLPSKLIEETYLSLLNALNPSELQEKFVVLTSLAFAGDFKDISKSMTYITEADKLRIKCVDLKTEQQMYYLHTKARILAALDRFEEAIRLAEDSFQLSMTHNDGREALLLKGFCMQAMADVHQNSFFKSRSIQIAQESIREYGAALKFFYLAMGNHIFTCNMHMGQGGLHELVGDLSAAVESYEQGLCVLNVIMDDCIHHVDFNFLIGRTYESLGELTKAVQPLITAFNLSCKILGREGDTQEYGGTLINVLKKLGDKDSVEAYKRQLFQLL